MSQALPPAAIRSMPPTPCSASWRLLFKFISDAQLERGERSLAGYKVVYLPSANT